MNGRLQYSRRAGQGWCTRNGSVKPSTQRKSMCDMLHAGMSQPADSRNAVLETPSRKAELRIQTRFDQFTNNIPEIFRLSQLELHFGIGLVQHPDAAIHSVFPIRQTRPYSFKQEALELEFQARGIFYRLVLNLRESAKSADRNLAGGRS